MNSALTALEATSPATGATIHYRRGGSGPTVLFLHGILGLHGADRFLDALAQRFDVIAPHAPGWGPARDDLPSIESGPLDIVLHLVDLLDALGLPSVDVVGESIGGWMAAELAAIEPTRVRSLVLVNPLGIWLPDAPGADPFAQNPTTPSVGLFSDPALRAPLVLGTAELTPDDEAEVMITELMSLRAAAKFLWPIPDTGVVRRLRRIKAPTTLLGGSLDPVVPSGQREAWLAGIDGAALRAVPDAGHLASLEQPGALVSLIAEALG